MIDNEQETIGDRLLLLRTVGSIPASKVAKHLNMATRHYYLIEDDRAAPDYFTVRRLMAFFGVTSDYLLYGIMLGLRQEVFRNLTKAVVLDDADNVIQMYNYGEHIENK